MSFQTLSFNHISKIEYKLFQLLAPLGFLHNHGENVLSIAGYYPDLLHSKYKISVDLFGDYFHANPNIERFSDETILYRAKTAKEIRNKDKIRQSKLENEGYRAIVVWEQDLKK
jgi:G:T-mismatch repair DNA endonuclease (very short patch repair protein)